MAILDASPNAVVGVDAAGIIVYANAQAGRMFGYPDGDLIGQPVGHLVPDGLTSRHATHVAQFQANPVARPMGIGRDLAARRRDGTEFLAEISLAPLETAQGLIVYATIVDVSERTAVERELRESERRFRTVLESSPNAIIAVDRSASITYANPQAERTFGYPREELLGESIELLLPTDVAERHVAHRNEFLRSPMARPMGIGLDLAGRRKDGSEFPVEISLSPVASASGLQVFATVVDITARKAAEHQLLQAQKLESIGRLAGGIAHDFNNMLFAIRGYSEMLTEDLEVEPERFDWEGAKERIAAVTDAADRATALTSQLLAFSRRQVVSPRVVDVPAAVRAVEPMLRPLIGETIHVDFRLDPATGRIRIDPSQLDQILVNLAVNARDAMPDGGALTIETGNAVFDEPHRLRHSDVAPGPYVLLAVSDTGIGMDAETRERVFEPFFTTKEQGRGTGLGLATIYGVVRQAGGHIWLYSEPGLGTSFKLYFPRVDAPVAATTARVAPRRAATGIVLLVEDDAGVREMTRELLERNGFRVQAVTDGAEALAVIESGRGRIDVLVSDVIMPAMSGIELTERVHQRDPSIASVLLSGYTPETLDLERALANGAMFVAKPATSSVLLDAVERAIAAARRTEPRIE